MQRIAVAMSGGVDSSAAAALLVRRGFDVVGITLQLSDYTAVNLASGRGRCCSPADVADAREVAARLDIPHYLFDHSEAFGDDVVAPFVDAYARGRTPSPCITCNRRVKFDALHDLAAALGAGGLATGHYARLEADGEGVRLRRGRDADKDQSYFLFDVPPARLRDVVFPLGDLSKAEARDIARELGLPVADKPESYELCFIPDGDKDSFVERRLGRRRDGAVRHLDGRVLGSHAGLHRFTVGQRRGLGVEAGEKLYVISLEEDGDVVVGPRRALSSSGLRAVRPNWVSIPPPQGPFRARAHIRHRHPGVAAEVVPLAGGELEVRFDEPQQAVTPGQGVAFYSGDLLLGGAWIERALSGADRPAALQAAGAGATGTA